MAQFKKGQVVRIKGSGLSMTVEGHTRGGKVLCSYWILEERIEDYFDETTLELVPGDPGATWSNSNWPRN